MYDATLCTDTYEISASSSSRPSNIKKGQAIEPVGKQACPTKRELKGENRIVTGRGVSGTSRQGSGSHGWDGLVTLVQAPTVANTSVTEGIMQTQAFTDEAGYTLIVPLAYKQLHALFLSKRVCTSRPDGMHGRAFTKRYCSLIRRPGSQAGHSGLQ